jgi:Zn-dependent protease
MVLAFRLGPIPVRIHVWFFLVAALLGLGSGKTPVDVALWAATILVTLTVHELGHVVAARSFGVHAAIELTPPAAATDRRVAALTAARRAIVGLAGPLASIVVGVGLVAVIPAAPAAHGGIVDAARHLAWLSFGWGLVNLLPLLPLDGGHVVVAMADGITRGRGEPPVRLASIGLALVLAGAALVVHMALTALVCGLVAFQSARGLRTRNAERRERTARDLVTAAYAAATACDPRAAAGHCITALAISADRATRTDAVRLLAHSYATMDSWRPLVEMLESGGSVAMGDDELARYERAARELGRDADAERIAVLRRAPGD